MPREQPGGLFELLVPAASYCRQRPDVKSKGS